MRCSTLTRRSGIFARLTAIAFAIGCIGFAPAVSTAATTSHPTTMHKTTPKKTNKKSKETLGERVHRRLAAFSKKHNSKPTKTTHAKQAHAKATKNHTRNAKSNRKPHNAGRTV